MKSTWFNRSASLLPSFWVMLCLYRQAYPAGFIGMVGLDLLQSLVPLGQAWITKLLFDQLAASLQAGDRILPSSLWLLLIGQVGLQLFSQMLGRIGDYLSAELSRRFLLHVQMGIYGKVNTLHGLRPFEDPKIHDTIQMGVQGVQMGPGQVLHILTGLLGSAVTLFGFLGVLLAFNIGLALLVALAALPQLYAQIQMGRQRFGLATENVLKERRTGYLSYLLSAVPFAKELRLFNLGKYFLETFRESSEELQQIQRSQQVREIRWQVGLNLLSNGVSSIAFVAVVVHAFRGHLTLGDVTLYTSAVGSVQGALSGIVYAFSNIHESALFFSRYTELMALPQPIVIPAAPEPVAPLCNGIELRGVSFRYSSERPWVLKNVSLTIPAGSCLALVGLNGAGKTTLVKLLTRMYDPCEGEILWDGLDVRRFDPADLRRRIGAIFQDFVRFDLTAFENIALGDVSRLGNGNRKAAEEAAQRAARKAGIHEIIQALPHGYNTTLSRWLAEDDGGADLSGGEWQKMALARLLMREQADLLILDEPTAALDAQAECDIYSRFAELVDGRTCLLISHRFSTVKMADIIAVLEDGRIVEYGAHQELLSQGGEYARLYNMQAERYQ